MLEHSVMQLLRASLFTDEPVKLEDWHTVFEEMRTQTVAALPCNWLKKHPTHDYSSWLNFCTLQQGQWVRVMHGQDQLLKLLESNNIPCVIIKGAAAAMAYPYPTLRSMGDVDVLVKRADLDSAAKVMECNGYVLTKVKNHTGHHYNYSKDKISYELHKKIPIIDDKNEELLSLFEKGIDERIWHETEGYRFPTLPYLLNGLVLVFHINQHLREGLGLRQIVDWMMYVNGLDETQWAELIHLLKSTGMERLALTTTAISQRYLGLRHIVNENGLPTKELMNHIMEAGNFGVKAGLNGKIAAFSLSVTNETGLFRRLQVGGLSQWKAVMKYPFLRPFAWGFQCFHILGILFKNKMGLKEIIIQQQKGMEQRNLLDALGLQVDRTIRTE